MNVDEVAAMVKGRVVGNGAVEISGAAGIADAGEGDITYLVNKKLIGQLVPGRAAAVLVREAFEGIQKPQIVVSNPQYAFAQLLGVFHVAPHPYRGVSDRAFVSESAVLGENVTIYPFVHIEEGVHIGRDTVVFPGVFIGAGSVLDEGCLIYPNVTIREGVSIGKRVIIHAGAVIGADGFGYVFENSVHNKIPQVGGVIIEDEVEIGANSTVDRATTGNTIIGKGTKIDNLVQVAHNVKVGKNSILVAQVGIGGSTVIGDGVVLAGQAGIADHVEIESGTVVGAQAGVTGKLSKGMYLGSPARPYREVLKSVDLFHKLPELRSRIHEIEKKLAVLMSDSTKNDTQGGAGD